MKDRDNLVRCQSQQALGQDGLFIGQGGDHVVVIRPRQRPIHHVYTLAGPTVRQLLALSMKLRGFIPTYPSLERLSFFGYRPEQGAGCAGCFSVELQGIIDPDMRQWFQIIKT